MKPILTSLITLSIYLTPVTLPLIAQPTQAQTETTQTTIEDLKQQALQQAGQGKPLEAIETFQQLLSIGRQQQDRETEAFALLGLGFNYNIIGKPQQALESSEQALVIYREIKDRSGEATTLNNIGNVYDSIGQPQKALAFYTQALPISREVGDRRGEGTTLNGIGFVYYSMGQPQKALEYYTQALPITRETGDRRGEATTLDNIGSVYRSIGQPQKALEYYTQALPIAREVGDRRGEATTLDNIGSVYRSIGQPQKALAYYTQALPIFQETGDRRGEGTTLNNIGNVYNSMGQPQKALEYYTQALPIRRETGDRSGEGRTLNNIGGVYYSMGQPQKALKYYTHALLIRREVSDRSGEAATLYNIGNVYDSIGEPKKAIEYIEQSATIYLKISQGLQKENRQIFIDSQKVIAVALAEIFIKQKQPQSAYEWVNFWVNIFTAYELAHYTGLINADTQIQNPQARQAVQQWNAKKQQLEILRQQLQENYSTTLAQQFREFEEQVFQEAETLATTYPEVAELFEPKPDEITLLQNNLSEGTVVIQPVLLTNTIALFVLSKGKPLTVKTLPIDAKEFDTLITELRDIFNDYTKDGWRSKGAELYERLIRPIEAEIKDRNPKHLAIIATGKLRYIPFETLYDVTSGQYLIQQYPIHYLTRLSKGINQTNNTTLSPQQQQSNPPLNEGKNDSNPPLKKGGRGGSTQERLIKILALGNPKPQDPFNLPSADEEVNTLIEMFPGSEAYLGEKATLAILKEKALNFPFIHLATHGCFEFGGCCLNPDIKDCTSENSDLKSNILLFADEPFDIANAGLLGLENTELLVLSACKTALVEDSNGQEIAGMAYLFERAGAKAVMASLWSADDIYTKDIMTQFYKNLNQSQMSKSEALRQAKLQYIDRHPYFWSPFILIGKGE